MASESHPVYSLRSKGKSRVMPKTFNNSTKENIRLQGKACKDQGVGQDGSEKEKC